jgi:hypothetical protein
VARKKYGDGRRTVGNTQQGTEVEQWGLNFIFWGEGGGGSIMTILIALGGLRFGENFGVKEDA